ncbi:MAG: ATP-dependent RNA helicase HrpA [Rothia sp. (in: high G+C Gram-positive bacteria)]|nr:ATP-dependent RNA helicase HrpA [Rothia sp. (in: high G+C Gram-positive bacteria)]
MSSTKHSQQQATRTRPPAPKTIHYPSQLPVSRQRQQIMQAIKNNQVVIIAGETGSGKTTQIPKMCLELGLAEKGLIGHTQPRRLAARTVAERIAQELGQKLGQTVGYQVRFNSEVSRHSAIKLMTDGILLAEIKDDPLLKRYSVLIIDEAHERSLNIDFLLGYLKGIMAQRPDLKIIITSATIDPQSFARHFSPSHKPTQSKPEQQKQTLPDDSPPIIEVSGRTYPVEIRYRPLTQPKTENQTHESNQTSQNLTDQDPIEGILAGIQELASEEPGDILIFFSGEREIRDAAEAIQGMLTQKKNRLPHYQILPLYARLSLAEQAKVFKTGKEAKIVLATNVAETSLTVPGIKYVIDTGTARISRYSTRTKVQRLPIEAISQASANQRSGRCGRVSNGIAIRLYSQEDYENRAQYTDPEILRTHLAAVILHMLASGVAQSAADIQNFPFVQPPETRAIKDGLNLLRELGALTQDPQQSTHHKGRAKKPAKALNATGQAMALLPVDPRLARMIIEASRRGCSKEILVLAAALTIQDPRERPSQERAEADQLHARFKDDKSDFTSFLLLWNYLHSKQQELSSNQFRKLCRREYINFLRVREWQDLFTQLSSIAPEAGIRLPSGKELDPAGQETNIHRCILTGFLSQIGLKDQRAKGEYLGARGSRFHIFPGSALFKKRPEWLVAAELVETSKLWARVNAAVEPEWIEQAAPHLVKSTYSQPHWSSRQGAVLAQQKVLLFGLPLITDRTVQYWRVDAAAARDIFIRSALVEGDWKTRHAFFRRNQRTLAQVEELEARLRRRDLRLDDQTLFDFYDARLPQDIYSQAHFDRWWKQASKTKPHLLDFKAEQVMDQSAADFDHNQFPRTWTAQTPQGELVLDLRYEFAPVSGQSSRDQTSDGISVQVPLLFLNQLEQAPFDWMIPGRRLELITALIKSLPKHLRKHCVPAPDVAQAALAALTQNYSPASHELLPALARILQKLRAVNIRPEDFNWQALPAHLRFTFVVRDAKNKILAESKSLSQLQDQLQGQIRTALAASLGASTTTLAGIENLAAGRNHQQPRPPQGQLKASTPSRAGQPAGLKERTGLTAWPGQDIPTKIERVIASQQVSGYPALVDEGESLGLRIFADQAQARSQHRAGLIRLLKLQLPSPVRYVSEHLSHQEKLVFTQNPHGSVAKIVEDCTLAAIDRLLAQELPYDQQAYRKVYEHVRAELIETVFEITSLVAQILQEAAAVRKLIKKSSSLATVHTMSDLKTQLDLLIYPGFISRTPANQLTELPRYLKAMLLRMDRLGPQLHRDRQLMLTVQALEQTLAQEKERSRANQLDQAELTRISWMLQELRVSFFAQDLGTAYTVSEKRIRKALADLHKN